MANLKVMRTDGQESEILKEFPDSLRLHLIPKASISDVQKEIGDFVTNENHANMYAIIVKDDYCDKNIPEAVRLGLIQLFKSLIEEEKKPEVILLNYFDMGNFKSEISFLCILKELLITYFGEAFEDEITLVIYSCRKENVKINI